MRYALLALFALASANLYAADGDAKAGESQAAVCMACHGPQGNSTNPDWPKLAGQHAKYIAKQLMAFKAGTRSDPLMSSQAAQLSDQDMLNVAAYFAAQTPK